MTTRRYTAEDFKRVADRIDYAMPGSPAVPMLRQAAATEAKVMGLVEALERIAGFNHPCHDIAWEALSKFRGEP